MNKEKHPLRGIMKGACGRCPKCGASHANEARCHACDHEFEDRAGHDAHLVAARHTPEPWEYNRDRCCIVSLSSWLVEPRPEEDDEGIRTIVADLTGAMGGDNNEADAILMAAAPELLAALADICDGACWSLSGKHRGLAEIPAAKIERGRTAIAKATRK